MRKIAVLVSAIAGLGVSHSASAADLSARPVYTKAAPVVSYGWTGSYIGGYVGGAFNDGNFVTTRAFAAGPAASYNTNSSFIGGFTSGYNYQFSPNWLIGYESETGYQKIKTGAFFPGAAPLSASTSTDSWYSSWTARFGYVSGRSLFYAKGGATLAQFDTVAADTAYSQRQKYVFGYAVGGGWEYLLDQKWSVKAEYLYLGYDQTISLTPTSGTTLPGSHTAKIGLNYKWDPLSLIGFR